MKIERTSVDFAKWPVLDQSLWSSALLRGDFLDADGMAATWAPATKIQVQKGYGKWIHFLTLCSALPAEAALSPDQRVSEARLRAYLALLESQNLATFSIASRISDLREALRVMVPAADLGLLGKLCKTLQSRATPTRAKHTRIRAPFEVLSACISHMRATIGSNPNHPLQEAGKFRDGLALAFLALRPIRLKNFASIEIGRHMIWSDPRWTCHFPANETKERRDLRFYLPEDDAFNWALSLYLTKYRPLLLQDPENLIRGEREIHPEEAAVVRQIFEDYAAGQSPRAIAASLNRQGIPSPRGGLWNASTINGSRQRKNGILNNELYIGRITYNRQRFVKDPDSGKRQSRVNPEHLWVTKEVPALQIIDEATWQAAQTLRGRYSSQAGNKRQTKKRLLSGLVRCASCGGAMTIINRERYSCSARRERGTCTCPVSVSVAELEDRILTALKDILLPREDLIAEFAASFREEVQRLRRSRKDNSATLQKDLEKVTRSIDRALSFILEGDGDPGSIRAKLKELEARKRDLERQLTQTDPTPTLEIHPNLGELYRRKVQELGGFLTDEAARPQAMEIIRGLIERIEVAPGQARGKANVTLYGALASILDFALGATHAKATADGGLCRVLMVAGARNRCSLSRLSASI